MIDFLEGIDRTIVVVVNNWNSPFWDEFMWIVSGKLTWIPFYAFIFYLFYKKEGWKKAIFFLLGVIIAVALADLSSVHLFKNIFLRYRPSHNLLIENLLHFHQYDDGNLYQGGMYGFVSSHAANFLAVCTFAYLGLKKHYPKLIYLFSAVVFIVCYSRLYLGVHYLSDVFVGGLLGSFCAFIAYRFIFLPLSRRINS